MGSSESSRKRSQVRVRFNLQQPLEKGGATRALQETLINLGNAAAPFHNTSPAILGKKITLNSGTPEFSLSFGSKVRFKQGLEGGDSITERNDMLETVKLLETE